MSSLFHSQKLAGVAVASVVAGLALVGCGGSGKSSGSSRPMTMSASSSPSASSAASGSSTAGMPGMSGQMGDGLAKSAYGFTIAFRSTTLPAGKTGRLQFQITGADGNPVTTFVLDETKLLHFFLIRSDLTGYQHVHPTMAKDGTWTASLAALAAGTYRAYAAFITKDAAGTPVPLVLSDTITVPGDAATAALPPPSKTAAVDGYTLTLSGAPMAGMEHMLTVTVSKGTQPVTDLQPYLGTYAHLTAFHQGDLAFAHLHPQGTANGDHGGPTLSFHAQFAKSGTYRLFLQFQANGVLHTATFTLAVT